MAKNKGKRKGVKVNDLPRENEELSAQEMQSVRGGDEAVPSPWQAQPNSPAQLAAQQAANQARWDAAKKK